MQDGPIEANAVDHLSQRDLQHIVACWRAANYLTVGQIYLLDNKLLREPLRIAHVNLRLLGHWSTSPGLNFIYAHRNRIIRLQSADVIHVCEPRHGGPAMVVNWAMRCRMRMARPLTIPI